MARRRGGGAVFGIVLACVAVGVLFWNEGRAVDRMHTIDAGRDAVAEADPARVEPPAPDRLLHLVGAATGERVADDVFGVAMPGLRLDRSVEMYQWVERSRRDDGGSKYEYEREWRAKPQQGFDNPIGHENPEMIYGGARFYAAPARLGAYTLAPELLDGLAADRPVPPRNVTVPRLPALTAIDGRLYSGDPAAPKIGDYRIGFAAVPDQTVSVLAAVAAGGLLVPFRTADGDLAMVEPGSMSAAQMLALADQRNTALTWALRIGGTVLVFLGLFTVLRAAVSWIPFAQGLARGAAALLALVLALPVALSTIAFAWLWHRPLLAIGLLVVAAVVPAALILRRERSRRGEPAPAAMRTAPPPPPPPGRR